MPLKLSRPVKWLTIVAGVAGSAAVVLLIAFGVPPVSSALKKTTEPQISPAANAPAAAHDPLALSIFEQPRDVPEIRFADRASRSLSLADFRGRVVLLNIWATWCVPCRKEMPTLDRLQARLGSDEFVVIALSIDRDAASVERFYREIGIEKLAIYRDPTGRVPNVLGIPGVPATLLINRDGREIARKMGEADWDGPAMVSLIGKTIAARSATEPQ